MKPLEQALEQLDQVFEQTEPVLEERGAGTSQSNNALNIDYEFTESDFIQALSFREKIASVLGR